MNTVCLDKESMFYDVMCYKSVLLITIFHLTLMSNSSVCWETRTKSVYFSRYRL